MSEKKERPGLLYQEVMDKIKQLIAEKSYKPGDKLPSERDMAEMFGVSRVPVREAIKILEYMGILETVSGEGIYLRSTFPTSLNTQENFSLDITADVLMDLFELRCVLESSAAYYAAQRRTDADIRKLQKIIEETRAKRDELVSTDEMNDETVLQKLRAISHMFHTAIIDAAHNAVLSSVYKSLYEALEVSKTLTISQADYSFNGIFAHEFLLQKITKGEADEARTTMLHHLDDARQKMLAAIREEENNK